MAIWRKRGASPNDASERKPGLLGPFTTAVVGGELAIALAAVSGALLAHFENAYALTVSVIVGLGCGAWAWSSLAGVCRSGSKSAISAGVLALLLAGGTNFMAWDLEHPLIGVRADGISVTDARLYPWANVFTFRDGHVRAELGDSTTITGRRGRFRGTAFVAPVVPKDWTPQQKIFMWAVATDTNVTEYRQQWNLPAQGAARVIGLRASDYRRAIASAERSHHLDSASDSVLVHWTAYPADTQAETWWHLARIIGVAAGLWLVLVIGASLFTRLFRF